MRRCTPLNQAAVILKLSGQSDPDLQRYLRQTDRQTDRQGVLAFIERCYKPLILPDLYFTHTLFLNACSFYTSTRNSSLT